VQISSAVAFPRGRTSQLIQGERHVPKIRDYGCCDTRNWRAGELDFWNASPGHEAGCRLSASDALMRGTARTAVDRWDCGHRRRRGAVASGGRWDAPRAFSALCPRCASAKIPFEFPILREIFAPSAPRFSTPGIPAQDARESFGQPESTPSHTDQSQPELPI